MNSLGPDGRIALYAMDCPMRRRSIACATWAPLLTLVYLPHLDYQPQRLGPHACDWKKLVGELDAACAPVLDAAKEIGAALWIANEYTHVRVDSPIYLNRIFRTAGLLIVRDGPFGEQMETYASAAFAVCDHQIAHVYVNDLRLIGKVRELIADLNARGLLEVRS